MFFHFYFTDFLPILQYFFHLLFLDLVCSYLPKSLIYINKLFIGDCSDIFIKLQVPLLGLLLLYLIASGMLCLDFSLYSLFKFLHWHCHHYVCVLFNLHEFMHCFVVSWCWFPTLLCDTKSYLNFPVFVEISFVFQYVIYFRVSHMCCWEEYVFCSIWTQWLQLCVRCIWFMMSLDSNISLFISCLYDLSITVLWLIYDFISTVFILLSWQHLCSVHVCLDL